MSASNERELLYSCLRNPSLQDTPGYSIGLFQGLTRKKLAKAISDRWEDARNQAPMDEGELSAASSVSLEIINKEIGPAKGIYELKPESFAIKVNQQREELMTTQLMRLIGEEGQTYQKTGTWATEAQAKIRKMILEIEALGEAGANLDPAKFLKTGAVLQAMDINVEYDIEDFLPSQAVTILHGPGGIGKTWLTLMAVKAISMGQEFLGKRTKARPVVYVDFENPLPVLIERARALDIKNVLFWHQAFDPKPPRLDSPDYSIYKRLPARSIIVFDTLRAAHSGDENDSHDMALIMGRLKEIRDAGFTPTAIHHTSKANEQKSKGSTAITDLADHVLSLCRVRKGSYRPIEDDNEPDPSALFRFGTGDKTRFKPAQIFLQRNASGGFVIAQDPDNDRMDSLAEHIRFSPQPPSQTGIVAWAKETLGIGRKDKVLALLTRGEGTLWNSHKDGVRRIYVPA